MVDYTNEIIALINSLRNPRYGSQDAPHSAPILFDGVLQNAPVKFLAASDDPHDYGVDVWNKAQSGEFGPIAPYQPPTSTPSPPGVSGGPPDYVASEITEYFTKCARQIATSHTMAEALSHATRMIEASSGAMPTGSRGVSFSHLATAYGMTPEELLSLLTALEDLRFAHSAAIATYSSIYAKTGDHLEALQASLTQMADAVVAFNAVSPKHIEVPQ